jgi:FkbM family methyltransferase
LVHTTRWRASRSRALFDNVAYPIAYALNRPRLHFFGKLLYDLALRCNGIGIAFPGRSGLTRAEEKFLRRVAAKMGGGTIFDIGANRGAYSVLVRKLCPKNTIYAFEPHPKNFRLLEDAASRSGFTALPIAVSDRVGSVQLYDFAEEDGSTQASLDCNTLSFQGNARTVSYDVPCTTLDSFTTENGIERIALLKIDTEGFDLSVLKGAARLLSEQRIDLIQFEFIPANIVRRVSMKDFFELLDGYKLHRLCLNGALLPIERYSVKECEIYVPQNFIAALRSGLS